MLKIAESPSQDRFYDQKEQLELSRAALQVALSHVGLDEETRQFEATLDKLIFKSPYEIIATVLSTNGYALNLENLLSSLDQWRFGVRARLTTKELEEGHPAPRQYLPAARFGLPEKTKTGDWLKLFYREIEVYEARLSELEGKGSKKPPAGETPAQLKEEIRKLRQENTELSARLREMIRKLNETQRSQASMSRALEAQNYLPENLKIGVVKDVILDERQIVVRTGRKTISVPFAVMTAMPEPEDPCLLKIEESQVSGIFFHERPGTPFAIRPAHVLLAADDVAKFRDDDRRIFLVRADNDAERANLRSLKRGEKALLYLAKDRLVRFEALSCTDTARFERHVQEAISVHDIRAFWDKVKANAAKKEKDSQ